MTMKTFFTACRLTLVFGLFLSVSVLILWLFALAAGPNSGNAAVVTFKGRAVGAANVGQRFSRETYFWGRPSCAGEAGYDASASAGSNKGATNPEYLAEVERRINAFLANHPYLQRKDVPAEMVTASGSGLDPDISPQAAAVQIRRVAAARGMEEGQVAALVDKLTQKPLLGLFGPPRINVLRLNISLDEAAGQELMQGGQ